MRSEERDAGGRTGPRDQSRECGRSGVEVRKSSTSPVRHSTNSTTSSSSFLWQILAWLFFSNANAADPPASSPSSHLCFHASQINGFTAPEVGYAASDSLSRRGQNRALKSTGPCVLARPSRRQRSAAMRLAAPHTPTDTPKIAQPHRNMETTSSGASQAAFSVFFLCCVWKILISSGVKKVGFPLVD